MVSATPLFARSMLLLAPPTSAPRVPVTENAPEVESEVVATEVRPFEPLP